MTAEWKRRFWANTGSSYIAMATRLLLGLLLFRQLFTHLNDEQFGFWSLIWSLFGYGVLLDFGFGFTAQKAVAEKTANGDMEGLSRLLATIFWCFIGLSAFILITFFSIRGPFLASIDVTPEYHDQFGQAYLIFFCGLALMFPLGLFPEMLRGLQRIDLANWVSTANTIVHFVFLVGALWAEWSFPAIMAISVISSIIPNIAAACMAMKRLPKVSLSPRFFTLSSVKSQMSFSMAAYLITFSNLLMAKSDQLVIGLTLGVGAVTIYQAGYKMGEMLNLFSVQLQSALSPAAADLHARSDRKGLRELFIRSSRLTLLLITPFYVLTAVFLESLIQLLTGLETVPAETYWTGQALALAIYSSQLTNSSAKRILMMTGREKALLGLSIGDAVANVGLSVILAYQLGVAGVGLGTLIPTVMVGWLLVLPLAMRDLNVGLGEFLLYNLSGVWKPLLAFAVVLLFLLTVIPTPENGGFLSIAWRSVLALIPCLLLSYKTLREMTS
ncbi:lipopolysaccharide biosynthesis protein [Rubellicoccus peritrichatus]|uniref:Oligosaccharide flippase family protein n=1 Tax=Rubellicoccus peritrichatus TaxID=3080537 RepID=A0AAQ3L9Y5_9BACT|nr:oligosaccharide flippase family protein [Puniceicoccus sp. CR14]WOO42020.1 oligosaccharide flippase family protein [Puniceicoccus sp. CR14]